MRASPSLFSPRLCALSLSLKSVGIQGAKKVKHGGQAGKAAWSAFAPALSYSTSFDFPALSRAFAFVRQRHFPSVSQQAACRCDLAALNLNDVIKSMRGKFLHRRIAAGAAHRNGWGMFSRVETPGAHHRLPLSRNASVCASPKINIYRNGYKGPSHRGVPTESALRACRCAIDLSSLEPETTHSVWQELEDGAGSLFLLLTISGSTHGSSSCVSDLTAYDASGGAARARALRARYVRCIL